MNQKKLQERVYIKLDRMERRWLRRTILQFFQFHYSVVCYTIAISLFFLLLYAIPFHFLWGIPTLVLGLCGYIILNKKMFPLIASQCYKYSWKFLKLNIVKRNLMFICFFEVVFVFIMIYYLLKSFS